MVIFCQYQIMNELDTSRTKISFKPFLDICGAIHYFGCALLNLRQKINGLIMSVGWAEMGRGKSWDIICLKTERRRYAYIYKDILNKLPMFNLFKNFT